MSALRHSPLHRPEILLPRPHRFLILFCHHPADLAQVREVVRYPRGQQLAERHRPELGMLALEPQLLIRQRPLLERREVFGAEPSELGQQLGERD
jgi:hypothetical protein